jgi:hypothetical protein
MYVAVLFPPAHLERCSTREVCLCVSRRTMVVWQLEGFERLTTVSDEKSAVSSNVVRPAPSETSSLQSSMGVGDMMGDYQCIAVMTHGVTGACYLVRHLAQGNLYVLKVRPHTPAPT